MRISDWSSDVCSSDLLGPHSRQNIVEKRLRQFDLRNMRVDVDAFDRGRRLHEREPAFGRRRDILFKVEPIERAHIELRLAVAAAVGAAIRSEEHTSELQSLMRISYAVFCLKKKKQELKH